MKLLAQYIKNQVDISDNDLHEFCNYFITVSVKKKDFLLKQGDICNFEGFITKGCFRLYTIDEKGNEHTLYFGIKNWWVTDLNSFLNKTPATFTIQALEDSTVLLINRENKNKSFEQIPAIEKMFRVMTQKSHVALEQRMIRNISTTADQRYIEFIRKYPQIAERLTNIQIASYLGISHEFLSKIRRKIVK
ncbi:cAMP-binding domain of CRP or a regulatory subunit of cAMP-dependent protein kinases [Tenacibaculum sp. MAR_2009_124]|uniref:Crp/Fnr family transcriptional regulator n=1 Tax=Tenacibaculum sp. MAR_2009_124 TaxID=1250059 RepID=UPI00089B158F|nr:Crp/Fnr family transcriptional regulator [Tenacibaculum sp. MAR_2009_124]SEB54348.1 cAMP-binding domain of CRP or a regulatory subunit of cAMP-dependent protein kinases [Tenacibaculum sp. MAR_2009_124]